MPLPHGRIVQAGAAQYGHPLLFIQHSGTGQQRPILKQVDDHMLLGAQGADFPVQGLQSVFQSLHAFVVRCGQDGLDLLQRESCAPVAADLLQPPAICSAPAGTGATGGVPTDECGGCTGDTLGAVQQLTELVRRAVGPTRLTREELEDRAKVMVGLMYSASFMSDERITGGLPLERDASILADMLIDGIAAPPAAPGRKNLEIGFEEGVAGGRYANLQVVAASDTEFILDFGFVLEGLYRNPGTHAAGVVIGERPLREIIPLSLDKDKEPVTQFTMEPLGELGLLKMDFLGLKTLTVIQETLDLLQETRDITIDLDNLPDDDQRIALQVSPRIPQQQEDAPGDADADRLDDRSGSAGGRRSGCRRLCHQTLQPA